MRRHFAPEEKARLVLLVMRSKQPAAAICRTHGVSGSLYYLWRKHFIRGGTEALTRSSKHQRLPTTRRPLKNKDAPSDETEKFLLLQSVEAARAKEVQRPTRIPETTKLAIVDLINASNIPKKLAVSIADIPRSTYYLWRKRSGLTRSPREERSESKYVRLTDRGHVKDSVFRVLHSPPSDHGFNRTTWKINDLQQALKLAGMTVGRHAIRTIIRKAGYRWLKARKVLTSNDREYRAKLDAIQGILGSLAKDEGFFSIDEYVPFSVKRRAGRQLVAPGEIATVLQWQRSKGVLIITAALELSTNQVTHFYSEKKNTEEMIRLLDILLERNHHFSKIYLSWDAASWHASKRLSERIASNNAMADVMNFS